MAGSWTFPIKFIVKLWTPSKWARRQTSILIFRQKREKRVEPRKQLKQNVIVEQHSFLLDFYLRVHCRGFQHTAGIQGVPTKWCSIVVSTAEDGAVAPSCSLAEPRLFKAAVHFVPSFAVPRREPFKYTPRSRCVCASFPGVMLALRRRWLPSSLGPPEIVVRPSVPLRSRSSRLARVLINAAMHVLFLFPNLKAQAWQSSHIIRRFKKAQSLGLCSELRTSAHFQSFFCKGQDLCPPVDFEANIAAIAPSTEIFFWRSSALAGFQGRTVCVYLYMYLPTRILHADSLDKLRVWDLFLSDEVVSWAKDDPTNQFLISRFRNTHS